MLVISYADFTADINKYMDAAKTEGIKIVPGSKCKRTKNRHEEFINILNNVTGIIPSELNLDKEKTEAILN